MVISSGILTDLLNLFMGAIVPGFGRVLPDAKSLLSILATIEICLAGLWMALDGGNRIEVTLLKKVMQIGFFVWVVNNYGWLTDIILKGFVHTGMIAGGGTNPVSLIVDPSRLIDYGFAVTAPIFDHTQNYSLMNVSIRHATDMLLTQFTALLILFAFFCIALLVLVTYLEFYMISAMGLILVPFSVFKHTAFLAERVFGAVISFGIRLMVLAFILSVTQQTLATLTLPPDPTFKQMALMLFAALTILALAWHAPAVAGGLMAGSPSLGVGAVLGTGLAVAGGIAAAGSMVTGAARQMANAGQQATAAASKGYANGSTSGGSGNGKSSSGSNGGSSGGVGIGGGGADSKPPAWAQNLSEKMTHSNPVSSVGSSSTPNWASKILAARGVIPHDTHSGGGMSVPLREV